MVFGEDQSLSRVSIEGGHAASITEKFSLDCDRVKTKPQDKLIVAETDVSKVWFVISGLSLK